MNLRRAASIAACMFAVTAGPTAAQAPWPGQPQQQQPAAAPWPGQPQQQPQQPAASPWSAQPQQPPACLQEFGKLRDAAQKRADAIRVASEQHKATPKEACALFNAFSAAEMKMIKFATDKAVSCGIPPDVLTNLKKGHARTSDIRTKVCQAAANPARPAGPSLSDALTAPVADSKNIRSGGGTFDTLSGTPLGKQ